MTILPNLVSRAFGWTAAIFYRVERSGERIPDGPVLVTANHPNALLDPLLIFRTVGRPARPLAKAPLFDQLLVGSMLRALGGLPVFRKQDDPALMHRNDDTFRLAIDALKGGAAVQIFPEGISHSNPGLVPLRTGAARIALGAEAESDWRLGLHVVPAGITYRRKPFFRGSALVVIGEPFRIDDLRAEFEADEAGSVRTLTERITERLERIILNLSQSEDQELIETAEVLYAREKGWSSAREREPMAERLPRLQRFAEGLAWLRAHDPERFEHLRHAVVRYRKVATLLGAKEADVPASYPAGSVLWYGLRELVYLLIGAPAALAGIVIWYLPHLATRTAVGFIKTDTESAATYKLATALFIFPLMLAVYVFVAWRLGSGAAAIAVAISVPLLGFVALAWRERWARVREDIGLFGRTLGRRRTRDRLAHYRAGLVREFDAILAQMTAALDSTPAGPAA